MPHRLRRVDDPEAARGGVSGAGKPSRKVRRAVQRGRDQFVLLSTTPAHNLRTLGGFGARRFHLRSQGAEGNHASAASQGCGCCTRGIPRGSGGAWKEARAAPLPTFAEPRFRAGVGSLFPWLGQGTVRWERRVRAAPCGVVHARGRRTAHGIPDQPGRGGSAGCTRGRRARRMDGSCPFPSARIAAHLLLGIWARADRGDRTATCS